MICQKCNKTIDDDSKFCSFCGEKVEIKEEITTKIEQDIVKVEFVKMDENISNNETEILEKENTTTFNQFFYSHHGSIGRKEFLFRGFLPLTILMFLLMAISNISLSFFVGYSQIKNEIPAPVELFKFLNYAVIALGFFLFVIISNVSVKRLHDTNNNGWWAMLNLIPVINFLLLLYMFFAPSKKDNIYGEKSEYNLNKTRIFLSIFYICMIFIILIINGFAKGIAQLALEEKAQKSAKYEEKKQPIQDKVKVVENQQLKDFNDTLALAEQGDVQSQSIIGLKYYFGEGIKTDYFKAFYWLEKAANSDSVEAQYHLGLMYSVVKQDYKKAFELVEKAALKGYLDAEFYLGVMYFYGKGTNQDYKKAIEWLEKAALKNYPYAQYDLGLMYRDGNGVKQDYKKAIEWFEKAANLADDKAQYELGIMYSKGQGVKQDYKKAFEWYEKATLKGNLKAQHNLGYMYYNGQGVKYDISKAIDWYIKSANQGSVESQLTLGAIYSDFAKNSFGSAEYIYNAKQWYGKACDTGSQVGCDKYKSLSLGY